MRKLMKWLGLLLLVLVVAAAGVFALAWQRSEAGLARIYAVEDAPLTLPTDAVSLEHGRHLFETRGCSGCHGEGGRGALVMDAGPLLRLVAPNITPAQLTQRGYTPDTVARAVRHGVRADGRPLVFMPSDDWSELSDADTAALVAYMQTLPDVDHDPGPIEIRPLSRVLYLLGQFPLIPAEHINHQARTRGAPAVAATAEYGAYVARMCVGCHRPGLIGGAPLAPNTPPVADLTPRALGAWSEADFFRAMREGKRPDGRAIDPFMPWPMFAKLSDIELRAIWLHLQSLPPAPAS